MSIGQLKPETTYQAVVGRIIVKFRKDLGIDQAVLAKGVGVTQSTWSRVERGESSLSIGQLAKAAEHLRVSPSTILFEVESAVKELKSKGVIVRIISTQDIKSSNGIAMIGAAALGALVATAVAKSGNSDT